jgi:hypothetical protein
MIKKSWSFELEDGQHTVQIEQGFFSKNRKIHLDGKLLGNEVRAKAGWFGEGEYEFDIGSHPCLVVVRNSWLTHSYDLAIDGKSITTGLPLTGIQPMPGWAWAFVVGCALIPLISGGGALPLLVGLGGVTTCISIARDTTKTTAIRLALCSGVTVLAWILFVALAIGIAILQS